MYVRTTGRKQDGSQVAQQVTEQGVQEVLHYVRWVMVRKRNEKSPAPAEHVPQLAERVAPAVIVKLFAPIALADYDFGLAGSRYRFGDYSIGEKIDHVDGVTVEEAEHQIATRLYQNTARVHFNQFAEAKSDRSGRRLIYGGHVISLAGTLVSTGSATLFTLQRSMAAATSRRYSPAAQFLPGRKCRQDRAARPGRHRGVAAAHRRHQGPPV